jgi:hypothetical protein
VLIDIVSGHTKRYIISKLLSEDINSYLVDLTAGHLVCSVLLLGAGSYTASQQAFTEGLIAVDETYTNEGEVLIISNPSKLKKAVSQFYNLRSYLSERFEIFFLDSHKAFNLVVDSFQQGNGTAPKFPVQVFSQYFSQ